MDNWRGSINGRYIIYFFYFILYATLYYVSVELIQPLKPIAILIVIIGSIFLGALVIERIYIGPIAILWMMSIFPYIFTLFYTTSFSASLQFILLYVSSIIIFILIASSKSTTQNYALDLHYYMSMTIMLTTLFSYFLPSYFGLVFMPLLSEGAQNAYMYFLNKGELSGISGQTGTNAFLLSIGLAFLLFKKKSGKNIILILLFTFVLIMSGKRGILLANIIAYVSVLFICLKSSYKKLLLFFVIAVTFTLVIWRGFALNLFYNLNEFSSGRILLYKEALNIFKENIWFGTGINTYSSLVTESLIQFEDGLNAHNVYFQLLAEVGIVGFVFYIIAQFSTFIYTLKIKKETHYELWERRINYIHTSLYFQVFFFVYSLVGNPLYDYNFFIIYLLLIAPLINKKTKKNGVD